MLCGRICHPEATRVDQLIIKAKERCFDGMHRWQDGQWWWNWDVAEHDRQLGGCGMLMNKPTACLQSCRRKFAALFAVKTDTTKSILKSEDLLLQSCHISAEANDDITTVVLYIILSSCTNYLTLCICKIMHWNAQTSSPNTLQKKKLRPLVLLFWCLVACGGKIVVTDTHTHTDHTAQLP